MRMRLTVAAARGSQGQAEIWSAGSKHQFTALRAAPGVRLLDGVGPAKEQRRQRTAAPPHLPPRTRPARPETRTRPPSPADGETPAGADPQPRTGFSRRQGVPEGTSDFGAGKRSLTTIPPSQATSSAPGLLGYFAPGDTLLTGAPGWRSARTGGSWPAAARTRGCGCGSRPAASTASLTGHTGWVWGWRSAAAGADRSVTFLSARAPIRCAVAISRSTRLSVTSRRPRRAVRCHSAGPLCGFRRRSHRPARDRPRRYAGLLSHSDRPAQNSPAPCASFSSRSAG